MRQTIVKIFSLIAMIMGWVAVAVMWLIFLLQAPIKKLFGCPDVAISLVMFPIVPYVQTIVVAIMCTIGFFVIRSAKTERKAMTMAIIALAVCVGFNIVYHYLAIPMNVIIANSFGSDYLVSYNSLLQAVSMFVTPFSGIANLMGILTAGAVIGIATKK